MYFCSKYDIYGALYRDKLNPNVIIFAFRGTTKASIKNLQIDGKNDLIDFKLSDCIDCKVHDGFYSAYLSIR